MGYNTDFYGEITVEPPLNAAEREFLTKFADIRQDMPGCWCCWVPSDDGTIIEWNREEKFYDAELWMSHIIDCFLCDETALRDARAQGETFGFAVEEFDRYVSEFTFDHVLNGEIEADGEDSEDFWLLVVKSNEVSTRDGNIVYE